LNQSVILQDIGYATGKTPYDYLLNNAIGNLIIAVAGYVPGYFLTVAFIELLGRKWIQIQGFLVTALMFGILAGANDTLSSGARFALIVIAQLFFNFGPNVGSPTLRMRLLSILEHDEQVTKSLRHGWQFTDLILFQATTFIIPGECFPSRVRGVAHGFCAAVGKIGAILSGLAFNYLSQKNKAQYPGSIGFNGVMWIFFAFELLGAVVTFFCVPETKGRDSDADDFEEYQARAAAEASA